MPKLRLRPFLLTILPLMIVGCTSTETKHRDWTDYEGPGAKYFHEEDLTFWEINDPAEPTNRVLDDGVHFAAEYVVGPLATGWRFITPKDVRSALTRVGENLLFPVRAVSNLAQGKTDEAGVETHRFALNTTVGVLGIRDSATKMGVEAPPKQDMGLAFRTWGWEDTSYNKLPKATTRDSVGFIPDSLLDPLFWLSPAGYVRSFNDMSDKVPSYVDFGNTTYDPYRLERLARYLDRTLDPTDLKIVAEAGGATDTLQYAFLGLENKDFAGEKEEEEVELESTGKDFPYSVWLQDHPAPVMYVIPGTGGHRNAGSTAALAEMAFKAGYHAVTISSTLNFEFIETGSTQDFCGFAPADSHDVHVALTAIDADLRDDHGDLIGRRRGVMGISMGAYHALFMAAAEKDAQREELIKFDGYLAINPPVNLLRAAKGFDEYFDIPLKLFPDDEKRVQRMRMFFRYVLDIAGGGDLRPGKPLPMNEKGAQFLIGFAFKMTLLDILDQAQANGVTGDFFQTPRTNRDRSAGYREKLRYSWIEYFYAFVLPEQARRRNDVTNDEAGAHKLFNLCDLRTLEPDLARNPRIRVVTNRNDMLLHAGDAAFLEHLFGWRLTMHETGGHLGNLWQPKVRGELMDEMRAMIPHE